jgi:hypothetical protein
MSFRNEALIRKHFYGFLKNPSSAILVVLFAKQEKKQRDFTCVWITCKAYCVVVEVEVEVVIRIIVERREIINNEMW